jgi:hypothetical protein
MTDELPTLSSACLLRIFAVFIHSTNLESLLQAKHGAHFLE